MKKLALVATVFAVIAVMSFSASAQGKFALNIGADVMVPMGDFSDVVSIGFGGTVRGEYAFTPVFSGTFRTGYLIWTGKDREGVELGNWSGIPIFIGGKYYFQPQGNKMRFYGSAELGLMILSVSVPEVKVGDFVVGGGSASSTEFAFTPTVGLEVPAGPKAVIDFAVGYMMIASSGSAHNITGRVGYKFMLN